MGKKRAQKDRAYITASEWRDEHGGHKGRLQGAGTTFKRLPYNCCAISFQPFEDPVCTPDGTVMDIINAVPYVQKFKRHPVTGQPLELKDLVRLNFNKNTDGEYCCPALGKVFNENTHIVAVKTSGNVYCWEALDELCLKPKNLRDLITDEAFTKKDIIHLQDPMNLSGKNLAEFDHVKKELSIEDEEERRKREADPLFGIKAVTEDAQRALNALNSEEASAAFKAGGGGKKAEAERLLMEAKATATTTNTHQEQIKGVGGGDPRLRSAPKEDIKLSWKPGATLWNTDEPSSSTAAASGGGGKATTTNKNPNSSNTAPAKFDPLGGRTLPKPYSCKYEISHVTTGAASKSFTSTATTVSTKNERVMVLQLLKPKAKGYLRLHTNLGDINLELHCDVCPKTCENFLALAEGGYYTGTKFHRSIKNFMLQGGDPTGTGKGGMSIFGGKDGKFEDELDSRLTHSERGILSMANAGPNTNGSQFFILYKSARHLDFKHTVFGRVVGGFETLTSIERVVTDDDDRPVQDIEITGVTVFVNPYKDMLEEEKKKEEAEERKKKGGTSGGVSSLEGGDGDERRAWFSNPAALPAKVGTAGISSGTGVGKYLQIPSNAVPSSSTAPGGDGTSGEPMAKKAKTAGKTQLSNFDAW